VRLKYDASSRYWLQSSLVFFVIIFSFWIRQIIPILPYFGNKHDDALYVNLAKSLIEGRWLGEWSNLTLAKPPGYAFFLFFSNSINLSPLIFTHAILVVSALIIFKALNFLKINFIFRFITLILILFNPIFYGAQSSRIYRDALIGVLLLLIFSLTFYAAAKIEHKKFNLKELYILVFTTSLLIAFLYLTKEDVALWSSPLFIYTILYLPYLYSKKNLSKYFFFGVTSIAIFIFTFFFLVETIKYKNKATYGLSVIQDTSSGSFSTTYKLLASLPGSKQLDYSYVDSARRNLAYEVSPTFKRLQRAIESPGPNETNWYQISCEMAQICEDAGPWFIWQLRDAAAIEISNSDPTLYSNFFDSISSELQAYCSTSKSCGYKPISIMLPPLDIIEGRRMLDSLFKVLSSAVSFDSANPSRQLYFEVNDSVLAEWMSVVRDLEIYWNMEPNSYNKDATSLTSYVNFMQQLFKFFFLPLFIMSIFIFLTHFSNRLKLLLFLSFMSFLLHVLLLSYADSHAGAIGLGRTTYLLESTPIFYSTIFTLFALSVNSLAKNIKLRNS
jgi:uncharacterized membrane protein